MQPGSVIYDLAAVQGGNTAVTKADEEVDLKLIRKIYEHFHPNIYFNCTFIPKSFE